MVCSASDSESLKEEKVVFVLDCVLLVEEEEEVEGV
jgi:hypothetical protein